MSGKAINCGFSAAPRCVWASDCAFLLDFVENCLVLLGTLPHPFEGELSWVEHSFGPAKLPDGMREERMSIALRFVQKVPGGGGGAYAPAPSASIISERIYRISCGSSSERCKYVPE